MEFANRTWWYEFSEIPNAFDESACKTVAAKLLKRYSVLTTTWTVEKNSEWLCRAYLSAKLIMQATLTINSMEYANSRNLRVVVPYLRYYSLLSLLRSLILTLPEQQWNEGQLLEIGHDKAIRIVADHIAHLDKSTAEYLRDQDREMKSARELISYRAPSSGDSMVPDIPGFLSQCTLLAELAQFNSELLEASIIKNADPTAFALLQGYLYRLSNVKIGNHLFGDPEDAYRLDYFHRKQPHMQNLRFLMREGHVDNFFGAWSDPDEKPDVFDSDENTSIIFDIP